VNLGEPLGGNPQLCVSKDHPDLKPQGLGQGQACQHHIPETFPEKKTRSTAFALEFMSRVFVNLLLSHVMRHLLGLTSLTHSTSSKAPADPAVAQQKNLQRLLAVHLTTLQLLRHESLQGLASG